MLWGVWGDGWAAGAAEVCCVTKTPEEDVGPGMFVGDECSSPMQLAGQRGLVR